MNPNRAQAAASSTQNSSTFRLLARVGYVVLGLLHVIIGAIAISVAVGAGGGEADQSGALEQVARAPFGVVVLWIIVLGLVALAVWNLVEGFVAGNETDSKKKWGHRVKVVGTAIAYLGIAATALMYALGGQSSSSESTTSFSAALLATPGGVVLLIAIGLVVAGVGIAFVVRGIRRDFEEQLSLPAGAVGTSVRALGVVGYIAKGVAIAVVGLLFVVAAATADPDTAGGLDSALKTLATLPFGQFILWLVGAGLVIYGVYCFARAKYARL